MTAPVPTLLDLDQGPWRYHAGPAQGSTRGPFVESSSAPDVRLSLSGNFGNDAERATYGIALAAALNSVYAASQHLQDAGVGHRQLEALDSLAKVASTFANELSAGHPDVVEAFAALKAAETSKAALFQPKSEVPWAHAIVPYEERLSSNPSHGAGGAREAAMQAELAEWRALAQAQARAANMTRGADSNYNTGFPDLDLLLGLTEDMVTGNANMDTGLLWLATLERVRATLKKTGAV